MTSSRQSAPTTAPELSDETVERLRLGWAEELSVHPDVVGAGGEHLVAREDIDIAVVLDLFDTQVVVGPSSALGRLEALSPNERRHPEVVDDALPGSHAVGPATLAYAEEVRAPLDVRVAVSPVQNVDLLRDQCTEQEWEESGLIDMPSRIAARREDGRVAAVAGFERWGRHIAQLGVLVDPQWRGQGYGAAAAARAAQVAQGDQLVPQWRCRMGNVASRELAKRLGFVEVGRQLVLDLS